MSVFVFNSRRVSLFADTQSYAYTHTHTQTNIYTHSHVFDIQLPVVWSGECQTFPPWPRNVKTPRTKESRNHCNINSWLHTCLSISSYEDPQITFLDSIIRTASTIEPTPTFPRPLSLFYWLTRNLIQPTYFIRGAHVHFCQQDSMIPYF